jgi:bifunctional DNA-binding transcriptional regulator/antitoxin component of YhaV-PrlF toxin-antitoxin module
MNATVDNKRRVVLPKNAKPGFIFRITETGTGYELKRLEEAKSRQARLIKANGMAYLDNGHEISQEDVEKAMDEIFN